MTTTHSSAPTTASTEANGQATPTGTLRMIPLEQIRIVPGFNPRGQVDETSDAFAALTESIRLRGVLQPILVAPTTEGPEAFELIAGERRLRASRAAQQTAIAAVVDSEADATTRHTDAAAENTAREAMDPVADARSFHRLLTTANMSVPQIAAHVGATEKLVTARLRIMELPGALHERIATGTIPLQAIKTLAELTEVHPDLATIFVSRLLDHQPLSGRIVTTWDEALRNPAAVLSSPFGDESCALPDGIHSPVAVPVPALDLSDEARANWRTYCKARQRNPDSGRMWLDRDAVGQAVALSSTYPLDTSAPSHLILGTDVLVQIVTDRLAVEATRIAADQHTARGNASAAGAAPGAEKTPEQKRKDREAEQKTRRAAQAHNAELGAVVWGSLLNIEVDDRVLHALLVAQPLNDLGRLAEAGARYCLPEWSTQKPGRDQAKVEYPKITECRRLAEEFLAGAKDRASRAGRCFALLAMARYADQRAVAPTSRSYYSLRLFDGDSPWGVDVRDLIDDVCKDLLPKHLTDRAINERAKDRAKDEQRRAREQREARAKATARKRLAELNGKFDALDAAALKRAVADASLVFGAKDPQAVAVKQAVAKVRAARRRTAKAAGKPKKGAAPTARRKPGGRPAPRKEAAAV